MIYELYKALQDYLEIGSRRLVFLISLVAIIVVLSPLVYSQWKKKISFSDLFNTRDGRIFLFLYISTLLILFVFLYYFKTKFNVNFLYDFSLSKYLPFDFLKPEYP